MESACANRSLYQGLLSRLAERYPRFPKLERGVSCMFYYRCESVHALLCWKCGGCSECEKRDRQDQCLCCVNCSSLL